MVEKVKDGWIVHTDTKSKKCKYYYPLTDEDYKNMVDNFTAKPTIEKVKAELLKIHKGGVRNTHTTKYFIRKIMNKVKLKSAAFSVEEVLNNKELMGIVMGIIKSNPKVFCEKTIAGNIRTCFNLTTNQLAGVPTNYPIKSVRKVLKNVEMGSNYYDFSCGWGGRLLGALSSNVNYFGTDPNPLLCDELNNIAKLYKEVNKISTEVEIKNIGSEIFVKEWENIMDIAFSSPPYFDLEDYKLGKQSINNRNYQQWLNEYWTPTVKNIQRYLKDSGIFAINIKNLPKLKLKDDMLSIIDSIGFKHIGEVPLEVRNRTRVSMFNANSNENIYFFKKQ